VNTFQAGISRLIEAGKARWHAAEYRPALCSRRTPKEASARHAEETLEEMLEELLDIVANAREELVAVERRLEQQQADIAKSERRRGPSGFADFGLPSFIISDSSRGSLTVVESRGIISSLISLKRSCQERFSTVGFLLKTAHETHINSARTMLEHAIRQRAG
jgi:hypothetical protein